MPDITPDTKQMEALVGKPLYEIWNRLCASIDEKYDMDRLWNKGGKAWTYEYNTAGAEKPCAHYTQGKTPSDLWLSWEKMNVWNLKKAEKTTPRKFGRFMTALKPIMMGNG